MTSEIKVNQIKKASGTTLTLGESGTTVAIASGATTTGMGRSGTVDWQTGSIKTGDFTAVDTQGFFVDTNSGAVTATLPAGSAGSIISFQDYRNNFNTNALTISPNGSEKINGGSGSIVLSTNGEGVTLVYIDSTIGWRSIQDNVFSDVGSNFITATGGTITTVDTNYKVHTFTSPGTFQVTSAGSGDGNLIDYLVVAGGGGGPASQGGGGGAGGFRESQHAPYAPVYTASPLKSTTSLPVSIQSYPITVGAGGSTTPSCAKASNGSDSVALTITSAGGGAGGTRFGSPPAYPGNDGGSGGGGGGCASTGGSGNTPPTTPAQGNDGADNAGPDGAASGGGGATAAGAVGGPGRGQAGGAGGAGATTSITGTPVAYAGGGGGGEGGPPGPRQGGAGGSSVGGTGSTSPPGSSPGSGTPGTAGTTNRGGGGGGGGNNSASNGREGGAGGSGIVVIRYKFQ
ncbi:glycine-rich domain-containing protein [Hyphomonas sp.]|uniref:glycine-rich domain-containing protein n=1 Tax=Hyphomonas sp. TaxID=87 RepID=UPI0025B7D587|nr:hypothetical protein [Hyphomonas sp.]